MPLNAPNFWEGLNAEAYGRCTWIGASRGQIDEKKETEAAQLRMNMNITTLEKECAALGLDWREVLQQRAREKKMEDELGLTPAPIQQAPGSNTGDTDEVSE